MTAERGETHRQPGAQCSAQIDRLPTIAPLGLRIIALALLLAALAVAPAAAKGSRDSCSTDEETSQSTPATTAEPLAPAVLARFAVLRRAARETDQPPPINSLAEQVSFLLGRYNPAYVRQLTRRVGGRRLFVVPGFPVHEEIPPARCLPRNLRRKRPALVAAQLKRERQLIACVVVSSPSRNQGGFYSGECPRLRDLMRYQFLTNGLLGSGEQAGVLPDGIATVRAHFSGAPAVQVPVVENFYLYKVDRAKRSKLRRELNQIFTKLDHPPKRVPRARRRQLERALLARAVRVLRRFLPTHVELLAADGHVVKDAKPSKATDLGLTLGLGSSLSGSASASASVSAP